MSKTYHFIGIKGSGMSALALMLHQMGHKVQEVQMLKSTTLLNVVLSRQELPFFLLMKRI